jgi:rhodanese-related sulfurtransferase
MEKKKSITLAELNLLLKGFKGITIVDVRTEEEYNERHISFAINLPIEQLEARNHKLDLRNVIITVCGKGGGRSEKAAKFIKENYIAEVYFLEGGTFGWFDKE